MADLDRQNIVVIKDDKWTMIKGVDQYIRDQVLVHLKQYTDFLLKNGYTDVDVIEEGVIDQYMLKYLNKL